MKNCLCLEMLRISTKGQARMPRGRRDRSREHDLMVTTGLEFRRTRLGMPWSLDYLGKRGDGGGVLEARWAMG